ncbi:hypothetical protein Dimus_013959 [Dionaea muscipula]
MALCLSRSSRSQIFHCSPLRSSSPRDFPKPNHLPLSSAPLLGRRRADGSRRRRQPKIISAVTEAEAPASATGSGESPVRIVAVVGEGSLSPLKSAPWEEVMLHTAKRLRWIDDGFHMTVFTDNIRQFNNEMTQNLQMKMRLADVLVIISVNDQESVKLIQSCSTNIPNIICFESSPALMNKLGGSLISKQFRGDIFSRMTEISKMRKSNERTEVVQTISEAWGRKNSDDIRFCILVIINAYIRPVPILNNLRSKGFSTLSCMAKNCGPQILDCLLDPTCRKALQCLNQCSPVDQVCNYRCIASYENPKLEAFSLCVLQKHNCLQLDAKIPEKPYVSPMLRFQGLKLCHESAEDLFVGWLGKLDWSWRVVAGQNPAYDQFPCQYQLFYQGKARDSFWYEPVFQVRSLDGRILWRRRKYRVKRDDLSWGLFHYNGAARVAGQSYTGAVLVSPDGQYPNEIESPRLASALNKCGIKDWELFAVDNCSCQDPPLSIPEGSCFHHKIQVGNSKFSSV